MIYKVALGMASIAIVILVAISLMSRFCDKADAARMGPGPLPEIVQDTATGTYYRLVPCL